MGIFFSELEDINTYVIAEDIVIAIISSTGFYFGVEFYQIDLCCKINTRCRCPTLQISTIKL